MQINTQISYMHSTIPFVHILHCALLTDSKYPIRIKRLRVSVGKFFLLVFKLNKSICALEVSVVFQAAKQQINAELQRSAKNWLNQHHFLEIQYKGNKCRTVPLCQCF